MKKILFLVFAMVILGGCSMNTTPPDYIKQFTIYKEGDGLIIYFILADKSGQMTTSDGEATIVVKTIPTDWDEIEEAYEKYARGLGLPSKYLSDYGKREALKEAEKAVFRQKYLIKKEDFVKTKIGRGAFAQDAIIFSFGRIPYSSLDAKGGKGKAELLFIAKAPTDVGGRGFIAEEPFSF